MVDNFPTWYAYCTYIRKAFRAKGIIIYNEKASQKVVMAGYPHVRAAAHNDNEAKP